MVDEVTNHLLHSNHHQTIWIIQLSIGNLEQFLAIFASTSESVTQRFCNQFIRCGFHLGETTGSEAIPDDA
jgi:hypothetical protein